MKYNFVYDTEVLETFQNFLSEDEVKIVLAIVIGKHNAIFYGYKPERLIKVIKKLTNETKFVEQKTFSDIDTGLNNSRGGIMYLKDFDIWKNSEQLVLYGHTKNDSYRITQFIATVSGAPSNNVVTDALNNFDIVYRCKESYQTPTSNEALMQKLETCVRFKNRLRSGSYITSTGLSIASYWMDGDTEYHYVREIEEDNPAYARKIALVARSLSDVELSTYTEMKQLHEAEAFYKE